MGHIYKITNQINGKVYIGQTNLPSVQDRFDAHVKKANRHVNRYLYDAMNHYGIDNFSIEEIEHCDKDKLDEREIFWISHYQSNNKDFGYNMTEGGGGGNTWTNNPHKKETGDKIRAAHIGKKRSAETLQRMSEARKGKYYIDIDIKRLIELIESGKTIDDICDEFGISYSTLMYRFRNLLGKRIRDFRTDKFENKSKTYTEDTRKHLSEIRRERWIGDNNPNYKNVDPEILYNMIEDERSTEEMTEYFNVSKPTLYAKIEQYFGKTLRKMRKELKKNADQ